MKELAILCIDDESTILHAITEEIRSLVDDNIIIESALNADEALEVCEELTQEGIDIALIISDCIMPGMQGDKLLEKLHTLYPQTYKVMLTGQAELDAIKYAINNANLYRYLSKPWDKEDMQLTLQSAIKGFLNNLELESYKKDLEDKVEERTKELHKAMQIVHEYSLYTLIDKKGDILESSDSFALLCGVSADKLIGVSLFDTFDISSKENIKENIQNALNCEEKFKSEVITQYLDNKPTWTDIEISPNKNENQETTYIIKRHDISDKKYVEELCDTDVLTTLYNRRFFNTLLPKELQRVKRDEVSFTFMMIDIDNFKKYNDMYGHQKGDAALITVASVLQGITKRGNDFAFRIGGEEFAIITTGMQKDKILSYANSINEKLYLSAVEHKDNGAFNYVTASVGVVFYENSKNIDSLDSIIKDADDLLYKAKENGRNQVVLDVR